MWRQALNEWQCSWHRSFADGAIIDKWLKRAQHTLRRNHDRRAAHADERQAWVQQLTIESIAPIDLIQSGEVLTVRVEVLWFLSTY
jgi:hypothetical protein